MIREIAPAIWETTNTTTTLIGLTFNGMFGAFGDMLAMGLFLLGVIGALFVASRMDRMGVVFFITMVIGTMFMLGLIPESVMAATAFIVGLAFAYGFIRLAGGV